VVFYDGDIYRSGDIFNVDKLSADPQVGRLTVNGFFPARQKWFGRYYFSNEKCPLCAGIFLSTE
jgi:hypothetical protein